MLALLLVPVSGLGALICLLLHINSYVKVFNAFQELTILMSLGVFVVWILTILVLPKGKERQALANVFKGYPVWTQVAAFVFYGYILVSLILTLVLLDLNEPFVMVRLFTGHCMVFYGAALALNLRMMREEV